MTTVEAPATRPSAADRAALGRAARDTTPLAGLAERRRDDAFDPVDLLAGQAHSRVPELVPVRHGRMASDACAMEEGRISAEVGL